MRTFIYLLIFITSLQGKAQKWNPLFKKGSLYFFSTYFEDSSYMAPLHGIYEENNGKEKAVRHFENGHLIQEKKWTSNIQTHNYDILQRKPFIAEYQVWDSLGRKNEFWRISEWKEGRRLLEITVYYPNGKKLVEFKYVQLTAQEYLNNYPDTLHDNEIDDNGLCATLVPIGLSQEWNDNGVLVSQKEYAFDPRPIIEEERRIGEYIHNYPNGKPWEIYQYPNPNPYRKLFPYKKYYENGQLLSELYFQSEGKAIKKEFTSNGDLSLIQWITNYNQIPNENRTQWYSYDKLCYRMRDESPHADTIEFERNAPNQFTYLLIKKDNITTINKNDPNGLPIEKTTLLPDSSQKREFYKSGELIKYIEQNDNLENITEFPSSSKMIKYQKVDGIIQGKFTYYDNDIQIQQFNYVNGIRHDNSSEVSIGYVWSLENSNHIDSLYIHTYRRKSYYPFTLCKADTSGQSNRIHAAISQFVEDWNNNIGYNWNNKIEQLPIAEVCWARGEQFTIIEVIELLRDPTYLIYYDNGYIEFLNRDHEWSDLLPLIHNFKLELFDED